MKKKLKKWCRETVEKLLERIKLEEKYFGKGTPTNQLPTERELLFQNDGEKLGWNQAIIALEILKENLKEEIKKDYEKRNKSTK